MKDTILIYHLADDIRAKIEDIAKDLDIVIREIPDDQIHQKMGYLLQLEGYDVQEKNLLLAPMGQTFVFFALNHDEQLDMLLQLFRMKGIPHIPYKAILTKYNADYTFVQLYQSVANEYQQFMNMKD